MIVHGSRVPPDDLITNLAGTEALAFHGKKTEFIRNIESAHLIIKLDAIEDNRLIFHTDVFRAQITVAIDNVTLRHSPFEDLGLKVDEL